jgi:hypothetical protein
LPLWATKQNGFLKSVRNDFIKDKVFNVNGCWFDRFSLVSPVKKYNS